jgi:hypothetical protein
MFERWGTARVSARAGSCPESLAGCGHVVRRYIGRTVRSIWQERAFVDGLFRNPDRNEVDSPKFPPGYGYES